MCDACGIDHPEGIFPEGYEGGLVQVPQEIAGTLAMGMADEANRRDRQHEMSIRLNCLDMAIRVKGQPLTRGDGAVIKAASSADVLASASAYYDFVVGKNSRKDDNDTSVSR